MFIIYSYVFVILKAQCIIVCFQGWCCCVFAHTEPQKRLWCLYWCCCISVNPPHHQYTTLLNQIHVSYTIGKHTNPTTWNYKFTAICP